MPADEALNPFGKGTLKELIEESRRLREQSEDLRKRMAELDKAIDKRTRPGFPPDAPPAQ